MKKQVIIFTQCLADLPTIYTWWFPEMPPVIESISRPGFSMIKQPFGGLGPFMEPNMIKPQMVI